MDIVRVLNLTSNLSNDVLVPYSLRDLFCVILVKDDPRIVVHDHTPVNR